MPKVWIAQDKGYDLTPAAKFGDIVLIYPEPTFDFFNVTGTAYGTKNRLKDFVIEDYYVPVGNVLLNNIIFGILMERFKRVNFLLFDARTSSYVPRLLSDFHLQMERR